MKTGIHPEYRPVVFVDTSTDFKFCQVLLRAQAKQLNGKMATSIHYFVSKSLLIRTRSILVNKNMRLQTAVWTASTKIRSQIRLYVTNEIICALSFCWVCFFMGIFL